MVRRRLTHFLFEVRGVTRGTSTLRSFSFSSFPFPVFLIILRFALPFIQFFLTRVIKLFRYIYIYIYIYIYYNVYVRIRSFSFARAKRTFFHEAPSVRGRDSGKYDFPHSPEYPGRESTLSFQ